MELSVNGARRRVEDDPERSLLEVLRNELDLTGTKYGCGEAQCGACTALLDGTPVRSCVTPVASVREREVTTIEGLAGEDRAREGRCSSGSSSRTGASGTRASRATACRAWPTPRPSKRCCSTAATCPRPARARRPIVAHAPALGNALFDATGERKRSLPLA